MKLTEFKSDEEHYFSDELGLLQGEYKSYDENGQLQIQVFYKDDILQGKYTSYHSNGQLFHHCIMVDGILNGEFKKCDSEGRVSMHVLYKQGDILDIDVVIDNLTSEDKAFLVLQHGIKFLS